MHSVVRAGIALIAVAVAAGCLAPRDQRPGFHLSGEAAPVPADWSFSDQHRQIAVEVRTPYLIRHSVTIWCASLEGRLYLAARAPETKNWPGWVDRDPRVRLGIGERVYDVRLVPLDDPDEIAKIRRAYAAKYQLPDPPAAPEPGSEPAPEPARRYWGVSARGD